MDTIQVLGWSEELQSQLDSFSDPRLRPARVGSVAPGRFLLMGLETPSWAPLAGRLRHDLPTALDLPAVGDWVAVGGDGATPVIERMLGRRTQLVRRVAGGTEPQVVCANVDAVLIVTAVGPDLNPRRLERYLAAVWESGAEPVVVLNKADLSSDLSEARRAIEAVAPGVPVACTSAVEADGLASLAPHLVPGRTLALAGSSGVGKSTLANRILGSDLQAIATIREGDGKGRHTTTRRELLVAASGVILIDTPGMRELGLWDAEEGLSLAFRDVEALAAQCHYRDCRHQKEPGCAVTEAVATGALQAERVESYRRLQRELAYQARAADRVAARQTQQQWKRITQSMRVRDKLHKKLGFDG